MPGAVVAALCLCAANAGAALAADCPNAAVRAQQHSDFLAGCRAYEMVSPADKNGGDVGHGGGTVRSSPSGDVATFDSQIAFGDAKGTGAGSASTYVARRSADGWTTHGVTPDQKSDVSTVFFGASVFAFSVDLDRVFLRASDPPLTADAPKKNSGLYMGDTSSDVFRLLSQSVHPLPPSPTLGVEAAPTFAGASDDYRHIAFEWQKDVTADTTGACNELFAGCPPKLYEWVDGGVRLVGIGPDGQPLAGGSVAGQGALRGYYVDRYVSDDGRRIFFTSPGSPYVNSTGDVYVRIDGASTSQLNASERTECSDHDPCDQSILEPDPGGVQPASFVTASEDGHTAFILTTEQLNDADANTVADLYAFDTTRPAADPDNLTLISTDDEPTDGTAAVDFVAGTSDSGNRVYFASAGKRIAGQGDLVERAIYEWTPEAMRLVGTTSENANAARDDAGQLFQTSPDGRYLLFPSKLQQPGLPDPDGHVQLYRFDADAGHVDCVSCHRDGTSSTSDAADKLFQLGASQYAYVGHPMLDDGSRVFFDTADALVPEDVNGVRDVYEWADSDLRLISTGQDASESWFAEASSSGDDVFFLTRQRLTRADRDANIDLYDARVAGGFTEPPQAPANCAGDDCQGVASFPPAIPVAGSVNFAGSGDLATPSARPAASKVSVKVGKAVSGTTAKLAVKVPAPGSITVSGASVHKVKVSTSQAATYSVKVSLSTAAKASLRAKKRLKVTITVSLKPRSGLSASKKVTLTFKRQTSKRSSVGAATQRRAPSKGGR